MSNRNNRYYICRVCSTKLGKAAGWYITSIEAHGCDICGDVTNTVYESPYSVTELKRMMETPTSVRARILSKALEYVEKDRNATHGNPEDNFATIARLWNAYLAARSNKDGGRTLLKPHDVAVLNILQKISRIVTSPEHQDNWVDIAGYAACGGQCVSTEKNEATH